MAHSQLIIDILVRLSIVLVVGWLTLRLTVKLNPRWSTLISRLMISACFCLPVIYFCVPSTNLEVLPPPSKPEPSKITSSTIENNNLEKSVVQSFEHKSSARNDPFVAAADSNLQEADVNPIVVAAEPPEFVIESSPVSLSDSAIEKIDVPQANSVAEEFSERKHSNWIESAVQWVWCIWICVSTLLLMRICVQIKRARRLLRNSYEAKLPIQQECKELATKLGLVRVPRVHVSADINGPCTAGLVYPVVFIPDTWTESLTDRERRAVLMHEISHVAGRDSLWDLLARIVTAIWWFHPLVWRLLSRHRLACEHTSDSLAAGAIDGLTEYRRMLAQWTLRRQGVESNSAVLAMADRSCMIQRLRWLEVPRPCGTIRRSRRYFFILVAVIFMTSFASVRVIPKAAAQLPVVVNETDQVLEAKKTTINDIKPTSKSSLNRQANIVDIDLSRTTAKIVHVVDEQDQPVEGAKVRVGWWEDIDGDIQIIVSKNPPVTDKQGEVTIQVPKGAARAQISAEAKEYAKAGTQYSMNGEPTLILKPGRIIRVKAIDTNGNLLPDAYPLLEDSRLFGREIKRDKDRAGYFTSPVVGLERRWMRVVDGSGEGPILFSDLIDVTDPKKAEADGTIVATLRPGIRLEGRLDDSVPRPVTNGCVELYINEAKDHRIGNGWAWQDTAFVKEDGTFVFESLPAGGYVQLFALVEGYQSTRPTTQELSASFSSEVVNDLTLVERALERQDVDAYWPHLFALPGDQEKIEVELPCTPTTSLDVRVVDSIGRPIRSGQVNGRQVESAWVKFHPNGLFIGGELFIPTTEVLSNSSMVRHKDPVLLKRLHDWAASTFLKVITDANGVAHVKNLPPKGRQTYSVIAPGYLMPVFPAAIERYASFANRYAVVDLSDGEKLRRTITMEKHFPIAGRKLMVVNRKGEPISDIKVTVSEIAFKDAPNDWELWASQRFGPIATGKTGLDGLVRLRIPLSINNHSVARLQVVLQGKVGPDAWVRKTLIIPRSDDGRVVVLAVSDKRPKNKNLFRDVEVDFLQPDSLLSNSPQKILEQLLVQPSLIRLNRLLKLAKFDAATPLRFRSELNRTDYYNRKESERVPVVIIPTDQGDRVIVLCDVRPKNAAWEVKPELSSAPSAAFVFDATDGSLIKMIGGWASSKGSYNDIILTNQGGTDDYFISTSAFEEHGPFNYIQYWYRVGHETQPALTVHNYANGISWDGKDGPSNPLAEFGYIEFRLNGKTIDHKLGGTLPNGAIVPRKIYWDGLRNQFIGPVTQSFDSKPLYRVVSENSAEFVPLEVKPGEMVIGGGRRHFQNWYAWNVIVPEGKTARLRLFLLDLSGDKPVETEIKVHEFNSGLHSAQLQFTDTKQDTQSSTVEIRVDSQRIKNLKVPRVPISNAPSVKGKPVARAAKSSADLLSRETVKKKVSLIWQIKLE